MNLHGNRDRKVVEFIVQITLRYGLTNFSQITTMTSTTKPYDQTHHRKQWPQKIHSHHSRYLIQRSMRHNVYLRWFSLCVFFSFGEKENCRWSYICMRRSIPSQLWNAFGRFTWNYASTAWHLLQYWHSCEKWDPHQQLTHARERMQWSDSKPQLNK